ncbi:MAG: M14 family zinc carboxypeptidase, partial [Thermoanaerobaculia bacterium]
MLALRTIAALLAAVPATAHAAPSAEALWNAWPQVRVYTGDPFALKHAALRAELARLAERHPGLFRVAEEGVSSEGRPIPLLLVGEGPTTVLLWSQMHGDEPTATSALLDILEHLGRTQRTPDTEQLLSRLRLAIIPMLNPDGAARTRRTNAQGIDVNRDALRLQTPEGRFLKSVRDRLKPSVGYNLHNHSPNVTAGKHGRQVAIS